MIENLGNGVGKIYTTNLSNTVVGKVLNNNAASAYQIRQRSLLNAPLSGGRRAITRIRIDAVSGATNLTALNIGGISQITPPIAAVPGDPYATAVAYAAAINSHNAASPNYIAYAVDDGTYSWVIIQAPGGISQSGLNNASVTVTHSAPGNIDIRSDLIVHDGGDASDVSDDRWFLSGTRVWLDARLAATDNLDLNYAVDISRYLNLRGMQHPIDVQEVTLHGVAITLQRRTAIARVIIRGGGGDLETIHYDGVQIGDRLTLSGFSAGDGVVFIDYATATDPGKNIFTPGGQSVVSDNEDNIITLTYGYSDTYGYGFFTESSTMPITEATIRAGGIMTPLNQEIWEQVPVAGGGTLTITPGATGVAPLGIHKVKLTGTVTLTGNYNVVVNTASAGDGDSGFIYGDNLAITNGGGQLVIAGITIPDAIALDGRFAVLWFYGGSSPALEARLVIDPRIANWITDAMIPTNTVAGTKLSNASIPAGKYGAGSIVTADLDPGGIDLGTIGLAGSISAALLDAPLTASLGNGVQSTGPITIGTADVLNAFAAPITVIAAPGANKAIHVIAAVAGLTFNTAAYATNVNLILKCTGSTMHQFETQILAALASVVHNMQPQIPTAAQAQLVANQPLTVSVETGNPTLGDSDIWVDITYRVVTV